MQSIVNVTVHLDQKIKVRNMLTRKTYLVIEVAGLPDEVHLLSGKDFPDVIFFNFFPTRFISKGSFNYIVAIARKNTVEFIRVITLFCRLLSHFLENLLPDNSC